MPGYKTVELKLKNGLKVKAFTNPTVKNAFAEITKNAPLYEATRIHQVIEAFYSQGKKDGAREAFKQMEAQFSEAKRLVPHRAPGRPRKRGGK